MNQVDQHIEEEILETFAVTDRMKQARPGSFFWTRIEASLGKQDLRQSHFHWQIAATILLAAVNMSILTWDWQQESREADFQEMQSIWRDFELDVNTTFVVPTDQDQS